MKKQKNKIDWHERHIVNLEFSTFPIWAKLYANYANATVNYRVQVERVHGFI